MLDNSDFIRERRELAVERKKARREWKHELTIKKREERRAQKSAQRGIELDARQKVIELLEKIFLDPYESPDTAKKLIDQVVRQNRGKHPRWLDAGMKRIRVLQLLEKNVPVESIARQTGISLIHVYRIKRNI